MLARLEKPLRPDGCSQDRRSRRNWGGLSLQSLLKLSRGIDAFTTWTGKRLAWLILVAVVVSAANAIVRKVFDTSSNSWLELQWVLFSVVFLLCSPWTLLDNEHIRIDIVNNLLPKRVRDSIDVIGHVFFLLPLTIIMIITGVPFFLRPVEINEQSGNAGGLPQWPAKSLIMHRLRFLAGPGHFRIDQTRCRHARDHSGSARIAGPCDRGRGRAPRRGDRKTLIASAIARGIDDQLFLSPTWRRSCSRHWSSCCCSVIRRRSRSARWG